MSWYPRQEEGQKWAADSSGDVCANQIGDAKYFALFVPHRSRLETENWRGGRGEEVRGGWVDRMGDYLGS